MRKALVLTVVFCACSDGPAGPRVDPVDRLTAVEVASGLDAPVYLTAPEGDDRLFIVEQRGVIRVIRDGQLLPSPFLDISDQVSSGGERGLLSMAFDPDYDGTGFFWVNYTDLDGNTRVERYEVSSDPDIADPGSALLVLAVEQPYANHNGGQIAFGPDGMLYIALGDGGSAGDPHDNGQTPATLLGSLLRLDVRTPPYVVPPNNPFVGDPDARPEVWAYGLRNPWRFSFDVPGDRIYIADVGQGAWEEINAVAVDEAPVNYGWNVMEGAHCYNASTCDETGLTLPVHEYSHAEGCSITGGYVYRGETLTGLTGHYFYSDFCTGFLRSFRLAAGAATDHREWDVEGLGLVVSFGEDSDGELYVLSLSGRVYRIEPMP